MIIAEAIQIPNIATPASGFFHFFIDNNDDAYIRKDNGDLVAIGGGGGTPTYTNALPTTSTVGGIPIGSTFSSVQLTEMWTMLLYPFIAPIFNTFSITGVTTLEVGEELPATNYTFIWTATQSGNVQTNSVEITDVTNASTVLGTALANDGNEILAIPSITKVTATFHRFKIAATNTEAGSFIKNKDVLWRHKRYWGTHPTFTAPNDAEVLALSDEFSTTRVKNYDGIDGGGNHLVFAFPTSFGTPDFVVNGLSNTAFTKIRDNDAFINSSGFSEPYDVWISDTPYNSPVSSFQIN